jgi:hypothetical protein
MRSVQKCIKTSQFPIYVSTGFFPTQMTANCQVASTWGWGGWNRQSHAAGPANGSTMVMMFVRCVVLVEGVIYLEEPGQGGQPT